MCVSLVCAILKTLGSGSSPRRLYSKSKLSSPRGLGIYVLGVSRRRPEVFVSRPHGWGWPIVSRLRVAGSSSRGHLLVVGRLSLSLCWRAISTSMPTLVMNWRGSLGIRTLDGPSSLHPKDDKDVTLLYTRLNYSRYHLSGKILFLFSFFSKKGIHNVSSHKSF